MEKKVNNTFLWEKTRWKEISSRNNYKINSTHPRIRGRNKSLENNLNEYGDGKNEKTRQNNEIYLI